MPEPQHETISMKTSYAIMQHHSSAHAPLIPTLTARRIVHQNINLRLGIVKIMEISDEVVLADIKKTNETKTVEQDDDPISVAFREMNLEVKTEAEPKDEEQHSGSD